MMVVVLFGLFFRIFFRPRFWTRFWSVLASILEPFWSHFGDFFDPKTHKNTARQKKHDFHENLIFTMNFVDFWGRRGSKWPLFRSQGRLFRRLKTTSIFASILDPKSHQNEPKMEPKMVQKPRNIVNKTMPKFTLIFDRLLVDFGLQIGSPGAFHEPPFLDPKTWKS
jgi:hypothetical protein